MPSIGLTEILVLFVYALFVLAFPWVAILFIIRLLRRVEHVEKRLEQLEKGERENSAEMSR